MSAADDVLNSLGYALFQRGEDGALQLEGEAPDWLRSLWPVLKESGAALPIEAASPFFENFLIDAEEAWQNGGETRAASGPWIETKPDGSELTLEASALTVRGRSMLLLARQGQEFEAKKAMLQTARETVIAYQRLNSEMQKKEVLLSWIAEQMNASLANVITSLRLIEAEDNPARTRQLLGLAARAADEQQTLIHKILAMFKAELEGLYGRSEEAQRGATLRDVLSEMQQDVASQFAERKVDLRLTSGVDGAQVAMEANHLRRVLVSFLETALTSARAEVTIEAREENDALLLRVCNDGAPLPPDICSGLFAKDASTNTNAAAMRLQFCRIAVENCGGEIGCEVREPTGNCFWVRLPKMAGTR
jgi:signal transduction histidine kinase